MGACHHLRWSLVLQRGLRGVPEIQSEPASGQPSSKPAILCSPEPRMLQTQSAQTQSVQAGGLCDLPFVGESVLGGENRKMSERNKGKEKEQLEGWIP